MLLLHGVKMIHSFFQSHVAQFLSILNFFKHRVYIFSIGISYEEMSVVFSSLARNSRPSSSECKSTETDSSIDVGTGGLWGHVPQHDFAINKEVPFLFLESAPFFFRKKCPRSVVPLQV